MGPENRGEHAMGFEFISGIFNYCDTWCERCSLSSRCVVFMAESESGRLNKPPEFNEEFWSEITEMFEKVYTNLKVLIVERGVEVETVSIDEEMKNVEEIVECHPLTLISETYFKQTHFWLNSNRDLITSKIDTYKNLFE